MMDEINSTVVLVREIGSILDTVGMLGVLVFLGLLFVNGRIHSQKTVDRLEGVYNNAIALIVAPYESRLKVMDDGFSDRLVSIERSTGKTEGNTARMAEALEKQLDAQADSRERMTTAITKLSTIMEGLQLAQAVKSAKRR